MSRLVSLVVFLGIALASSHADPRISGGDEAPIPYQVSVNAYGGYRCSGVIIDAEWILSTVHCLRYPAGDITVRAGSSELGSGGSVHQVKKIVNHDHYWSNLARYNDIALAKVEPPFQFGKDVKKVELVEEKVSITEGDRGVISGWGVAKQGEELPKLKAGSADIMSLSDCVDLYYSRFGPLQPGVLCAKNEGVAACSEIWSSDDSGAPLVVDNRLAGVFSWGYRCHEPGFPSVFMEVAYFRNWIRKNAGV